MDAIFKLCFLAVSILFLSAESHGCTSDWDCPGFLDSSYERYCCGSSWYSYCCDWSTWLINSFHGGDDDDGDDDDDDDDDSYSYNADIEDNALGLILAITFGVIGFIVFIVVLVAICVCCCAAASNGRTTTTHVYPAQVAPVAMVETGNASSSAYYNTQQPPAYATYNAGQGGHVTEMKY